VKVEESRVPTVIKNLRQIRMKKGVSKSTFSTHKQMPPNDNSIQIIEYLVDGPFGILTIENVDGNPYDILNGLEMSCPMMRALVYVDRF